MLAVVFDKTLESPCEVEQTARACTHTCSANTCESEASSCPQILHPLVIYEMGKARATRASVCSDFAQKLLVKMIFRGSAASGSAPAGVSAACNCR